MPFQFTSQPIDRGRYEPEAIYLSLPFEGNYTISQDWGANPGRYAQYRPGGVALRGHDGIDFDLANRTPVLAAARGHVIEIGNDEERLGRYVRMQHWWGESLYAHLHEHEVDSGQRLRRGELIGRSGSTRRSDQQHLHFGIRFLPYDRADGWDGYTNPIPFLEPLSPPASDVHRS